MTRLAAACCLLLTCLAARAGTPELPDDINARLARSKTQAAADVAARARGVVAVDGISAVGGKSGNGCNIAIGNIFEDRKPGSISTSARRETTVIVTGDVIQVGNNCR